MWTQSYLNYMLSDEASLHSYYVEMSPVTLKDIKRSVMLIVRESNISIPDPHYRLGQERSFDNIDLFSKLFTIGLSAIGDRHLEIRNRKIFVKAERQLDWQMLLPYMPPLVVVSIKIWNEFPNITFNSHEIIEYIGQYITPNVRFTCLPCPFIPQMEELKKSNKGFNDLHIHLNGALETDYIWQDLLSYPNKVYVEMNDAMKNEKVKEHFLQLSPFLTPSSFRRLLKIARNLRMILFQSIMPNRNSQREEINSLLKLLSMKNSIELPTHPMELLLEESINPVSEEAMFYILIFDYIAKNPNDEYVAQLFYYYLLILGQANKLLVQQRDCFGFEEFQKYTMNGVREFSEQTYRRRFLQLSGNELDNIRILEGRFSPKDTISKNEELIENIILGWKELEKRYKDETNAFLPELRLIAHFIKNRIQNMMISLDISCCEMR